MEFYDYKTAPVNGSDVVDATKTGMSFYDDFLNSRETAYLRDEKNLKGKVVMMSPEEYYKGCSEYGFPDSHPSVSKLKSERMFDTKILNHLKDVLTVYKRKFPMPVLNIAESAQEGLHRMMVIGDMFGWNHKVPVLVVEWADKQRAYEQQKKKRQDRIEYNIKRAVQDTLRYKFTNIDDLRDQLQYELDDRFENNNDDISVPVEFELRTDEDEFTVFVGPVSYSFDYEDVMFIDSYEEEDEFDDIDIEDLDIDFSTTEDFLQRYFGSDWKETHPHLKDTFNIKESFEHYDVKKMDEAIQNTFGSYVPEDGCVFIAPNGRFINIYPKLDLHEDLCYWLEENGFGDNPEDPEWFVETFGYVRCRNDLHSSFINVPPQMTREQYHSLEQWLEEKVSSNKLDIEAWSGEFKTYNLDDYFPEDILKIIKRSYASGKLY